MRAFSITSFAPTIALAIALALTLPLGGCALRCHKEHLVTPGESVSSIAKRYSLNESDLRHSNRLREGDEVGSGDWLYVPCEAVDGGYAAEAKTKAPTIRKTTALKKPEKPKKRKKDYSKYQKPASAGKKKTKTTRITGKGGPNAPLSWPLKGEVARTFRQGGDAAAKGIDLRVAKGAKVSASASGTVRYAGTPAKGAYGSMVLLEHSGDLFTVYSQLGSLGVSTGDYLKKGGKVGTVGKDGYLHFEVRRGTKPVDPLLFLPSR